MPFGEVRDSRRGHHRGDDGHEIAQAMAQTIRARYETPGE